MYGLCAYDDHTPADVCNYLTGTYAERFACYQIDLIGPPPKGSSEKSLLKNARLRLGKKNKSRKDDGEIAVIIRKGNEYKTKTIRKHYTRVDGE